MKRFLLAVLAFSCVFSGNVLANDTDKGESVIINNRVHSENESPIMPCYTYIGYITAGLSIDENGHLSYSASATVPYRNVRIEVYLQRSKNQLFWDEIQGTIKTDYDTVTVGKERDLAKEDYFYRAKVIVHALDSNNNEIESDTVYSNIERY